MPALFMPTLVLALFACDGQTKTESEQSTAPAVTDDTPPPPPADVDVPLPDLPEGPAQDVKLEGSTIQFTGAKISGSHDGGFSNFSGKVILKDDEVTATTFTIDLSSTTADHPKLVKHLVSKDFFHAEKYENAKFVSSAVIPAKNPGAVTHKVDGVLEFHGKSRPLSFPASITVGETETTVTATFDINRQNWGVSYPGKPDDLIKDDVEVRLNLTFPATGSSAE